VKRFARILACTDFSAVGNRAVETAFALAPNGPAKVWLLHAVDPPPVPNPMYAHYVSSNDWEPSEIEQATAQSDAALQELVPAGAADAGIEVALLTPQGQASLEILKAAEEVDAEVIVLGTRGRHGIEHFLLGSVAERVVRKAKCCVMVVH
jgi:nucleotide-binding universal stress UspA family protein